MAVTKANTLQSFEWFKNLLGEDIDKKIAKATGYTLPAATTDELGGIVVGKGLAIDGDGILDVTINGGESNVIEAVSVDGKNQPIANKTVNLSLSAYAKKTDLAGALSSINSLSVGDKNVIENVSLDGKNQPIANKTVNLNLSAYAKKSDITGALSSISSLSVGEDNVIEAISLDGNPQPVTNKTVNLSMSAYIKKTDFGSGVRVKGSVKYFSDLPTDAEVGDLYNIQTSGGVDGEGVEIVAGDNVVFTSKGTWDVMAGFIDTSIFVRKVHGKDLSSNDFTDALKAKLEGLDLAGALSSINSLSIAIGGLSNYTLPAATATKLGGIKIGEGLEMDADDVLNVTVTGGVGDVFTGATSIKGGASGIVPAPAKGKQKSFLRGDGTWADLVFSIGGTSVTLGSDVAATQGGLWQDYFTDAAGYKTPCLKLRYGDYEYNFNYDTSERVGTAAPALIDNVGIQYTLSLIPSTQEGGLWYEVTDGTPTLFMHKYAYNYGYNYDTITYKGDNNALYSYMPFDSTTADALPNSTEKNNGATIKEASWGGNALVNTGSLEKANSSYFTDNNNWTMDFWFFVEKDKLPANTTVYTFFLADGKAFTSRNALEGGNVALRIKNKSFDFGSTHKQTTLDIPDGRMHIAIVKEAYKSAPKAYINGKYVCNVGRYSNTYTGWLDLVNKVTFFSSFAATYPAYIDHFRLFRGQARWLEDFEVPKPEDYLK